MALKRFVKVPKIFGQTTKNFSYWKMLMINYFNILKVWDIVEKGYVPKYDDKNELTTKSKLEENENLHAVYAILSSVSESVIILFGDMTSAHDMWKALINRYEGNAQIKRTKLTGLEIKFETFRLEDGETIEDMYNRLMRIQNEFIELGEPLSNDKIVGKLLRVMLRKPRWEGFISALEAIQGTRKTFTSDELYAHFRNFEEKLRQEHNFALMATVDEKPEMVDIDSIIASKNITDEMTIEFLKDIVELKNKKKDLNNTEEASTSYANEVHLKFDFENCETNIDQTENYIIVEP